MHYRRSLVNRLRRCHLYFVGHDLHTNGYSFLVVSPNTHTLDKREREELNPMSSPFFYWPRVDSRCHCNALRQLCRWWRQRRFGFQIFTLLLLITCFLVSTFITLRNVKEQLFNRGTPFFSRKRKVSLKKLLSLIYKKRPIDQRSIHGTVLQLGDQHHHSLRGLLFHLCHLPNFQRRVVPYYMAYAGIANLITLVLFPLNSQKCSHAAPYGLVLPTFLFWAVLFWSVAYCDKQSILLISTAGVFLQIGTACFGYSTRDHGCRHGRLRWI